MAKYSNFMIDIETLGTKPDAAVVQLGVVGFNIDRGEVTSPETINLVVHPKSSVDDSTIRWWMGQSEEARKAVFDGQQFEPAEALSVLTGFLNLNGNAGYRVWSKPSTFDLVILESLYRNCDMKAPWAHWNTRDLRTLIELSGLQRNDEVVPSLAHDAGSDAEAQALTAIKAYQKLFRFVRPITQEKIDNGNARE